MKRYKLLLMLFLWLLWPADVTGQEKIILQLSLFSTVLCEVKMIINGGIL